MSTGNNTPRLLAAAKEFNIGKETLLAFLTGKGFELEAVKPTTRLTEEMYNALQDEFAKDKAAKRKSDSIALPKSATLLEGLNKTEEELSLDAPPEEPKKPESAPPVAPVEVEEEVVVAPKEEPAASPVAAEEKKEEPEEEAAAAAPAEVEAAGPETPAVEAPPATPESESEAPVAQEKEEEEKEEEEEKGHIETKSPKLQGPVILDKINLDKINLSTRPKKSAKKETPKAEPAKADVKADETPVAEKATTPPEQVKDAATPAKPATTDAKAEQPAPKLSAPPESEVEHIATRAPRLEGPKVIGKIELPAHTVGGKQERKEKRKRKRIPVEKKPENLQSGIGKDRARTGTVARGGRLDTRRAAPGRPGARQTPQEIDAKEIQDKIRETQAKLAGGGSRNRNLKAKYRRNKREEMAEKRAAQEHEREGSVIQVTEFISVSELANLLDVSFAEVISKCMSLGIMVSINQRLDAEVIELVASEFNTEVEFISLEDGEEEEVEVPDDPELLEPRAPVITIMGHVDHGKTSLLDYIRSASVVTGEAGGITQHIGAYRVTTDSGKQLTFLDTPGHEAFTAMRARGAKAADVAIIVIAADDAIMPQTREAISHAQAAGLPMVFALNKIDKEGANPDKIKEQLSAMNILVEDWGGKFQSQEISAKKGINIHELLEKVLLESELLELQANPQREAGGLVIEASLDKGRGYVSTILVQNGTLRQGDLIVSGQFYGKVKAMSNERGQKVNKAGPSTPVQVLGLNGAPQAGEKFKVYAEETEAKNIANHRAQILREQGLRSRKHITLDEIGRRLALGNFKELNVIIKADFDGSAEALSDSLQKLSTEEVVVNVVLKGVGQIRESDVMLASASDAIILGFQVRPSAQAAKVAELENIEIRQYSIIYDAIEEIKSAMEGMLEPKIEKKVVGNIEVREIFKISNIGTIAGCYVLDGKFTRNTKINVVRDGIVIHTGDLASLKRFKDDVKEVNAGYECGVSLKGFNDLKAGDILEGFEEVEVKRKL